MRRDAGWSSRLQPCAESASPSILLTRHIVLLLPSASPLLATLHGPSISQRCRPVISSSPAMAASGVGAPARRMSLLPLLLVAVFAAASSLAQAQDNRTEAAAAARTCTYKVKVKTSCASPPRTSDAVSVAFGDAYRNEAYGARLPGPPRGTAFERCGADTFRVSGRCGYGVCYLYLRRAGRDGWAPEWVQVLEPGPGAGEKPATFYFGAPLPDGVWYGHNRCPKAARTAAARTNTSSAAASPLG